MARTWNNNVANYLQNLNAPVTAAPLTMAAWVNRSSFTTEDTVLTITSPLQTAAFKLLVRAGDQVRAVSISVAEGTASAETIATITTTGWRHVCARFTSATLRDVFLDGANKVSNTTSITPLLLDRTRIGVNETIALPWNGGICEAAIWNIALSDAAVALLAKPVSPLLVRPDGLVAYWPIIGRYSPEIDIVGGFHMTITGTLAQLNHPRVYMPGFLPFVRKGPPPVAASGVPNSLMMVGWGI